MPDARARAGTDGVPAALAAQRGFEQFLLKHWISRSHIVAAVGIAFTLALIPYDLTLYPRTVFLTIPIKLTTAAVLALLFWCVGRDWFHPKIHWWGPLAAALFIAAIDWTFHIQGVQAKPDRVFAYTASTFVIFFLLPMSARAGLLYLAVTYAAYFALGAHYGFPPAANFGAPFLVQALVIVSVGVIGNGVYLQTKRREIAAHIALERRTGELAAAKGEIEQTLAALKDSQAALVRSESLAALGSLVTGAAHELRNPLGSAGALLQSLREDLGAAGPFSEADKAEARKSLELALGGQRRAAEIAERLYSLSDSLAHVGAMRPVGAILEALRTRYPSVTFDVGAGLPGPGAETAPLPDAGEPAGSLLVNARAMVTILSHLIDNAIAAGGSDAPSLAVHVVGAGSGLPLPQGEGGAESAQPAEAGERDSLLFTVSDSGRGIAKAILGEVFQPFFTTRKTGADRTVGLGLYIVHELTVRMGGSVEIESREGEGTRVRLRLPVGE